MLTCALPHLYPPQPKDGALFAEVVERYRALLASPLPGTTGAVFFAVCRGKASEGLDFSDAAGRAVVVTGIPFAMIKDPKVRIKMEMLTRAAADRNGAPERRALRGEEAARGRALWRLETVPQQASPWSRLRVMTESFMTNLDSCAVQW